MMRPRICPVVPVITGVFTHSLLLGVTGVSDDALAGIAVAPVLSPCQPLERPMSPCARRSLDIVILPPDSGHRATIRPLDFDMSTGLTMKKLAMYSTLPFALRWHGRGRDLVVVPVTRIELAERTSGDGLVGYRLGRRLGKRRRGAVDDDLVTRASDGGAHASDTAAAMPNKADLLKSWFMSFSLVHRCFLDLFLPSRAANRGRGRDHHRPCHRRARASIPGRCTHSRRWLISPVPP